MVGYIIRLDDASPTMNRRRWSHVFKVLDRYNIKPIVAVIPNNRDKKMMIDEHDEHFWDSVRAWQDSGYAIALHGYTHIYTSKSRGIVPMNTQSEFAGVDIDIQREKIQKGCAIFKKENIKFNIWVAPAHSFDNNTLKVLKEETPIDIVSDGVSFYPYNEKNFFWIPQQTWRFKDKKSGIWTICMHPNTMSELKFKEFEDFIEKNSDKFINDINGLKEQYKYRKKSLMDICYSLYFFIKRHHYQNKREIK